jgi:hypothetical protein
MATQTGVPVIRTPSPLGGQVLLSSIVNPSAVAAAITATPSTAPTPPKPHPPTAFSYDHLFVCTGTAVFKFTNSGNGLDEHAFVDFDLPDPPKPDPELEDPPTLNEPPPPLVFNNPFFPLVLHAGPRGLAVIDAFTAIASPATLRTTDVPSTWSVDWADADWNEFTGRITLRAQLALHGSEEKDTNSLQGMAYQVTFLAGRTVIHE